MSTSRGGERRLAATLAAMTAIAAGAVVAAPGRVAALLEDDERHVLDGVQKRAAAQATPSEVARVARERARGLALDDHPQGRQQDRPNRAPPQNYAPGRVPSTGRLHLRQAHERGVRGENQRTRDGGHARAERDGRRRHPAFPSPPACAPRNNGFLLHFFSS